MKIGRFFPIKNAEEVKQVRHREKKQRVETTENDKMTNIEKWPQENGKSKGERESAIVIEGILGK